MTAPIIPQNEEAELNTFDEYHLESFARGFDYAASLAGNPQAHYHAPIPGTMQDFTDGQALAFLLTGMYGGEE